MMGQAACSNVTSFTGGYGGENHALQDISEPYSI